MQVSSSTSQNRYMIIVCSVPLHCIPLSGSQESFTGKQGKIVVFIENGQELVTILVTNHIDAGHQCRCGCGIGQSDCRCPVTFFILSHLCLTVECHFRQLLQSLIIDSFPTGVIELSDRIFPSSSSHSLMK